MAAVTPGAIMRYRVLSYIVGTMIIVLFCIGVPLHYAAHNDSVSSVVGVAHGMIFYPLYLLATLDLARRARWSIVRTLLVLIAGVIPFLTFVAEHVVVRDLRADSAAQTR